MIGPDGKSGAPRDDAATRTTVLRTMSPHARDSLVLDLDDPQQRRLGDYELLERIGEGGMGVVYRARQVSLDRPVAVKLLDSGRRSSQEFLARFRLEAQSAARMQHPNIVTIHEIGATDRLAYFSMQLIEGCTLADVVAREGPLDPLAATRVLRTLAEAVEYAHELGVLHLDLKPANVLRDAGGRLYIADFGLARPLDHAVAAADDEISGTPAYMAPEQILIHQHRLTRATDIYGLGAILFELLTGRPPFRAGSAEATLERVLAEPAPSPRETRPKVSRNASRRTPPRVTPPRARLPRIWAVSSTATRSRSAARLRSRRCAAGRRRTRCRSAACSARPP
jgi:serine/threonine protein kinase